MTPIERFDLVAIGGGSAGLVTAAGAAGIGAKVALVERERMGGECLWTGCVPSKALLAAAHAVHAARAAAPFGIDVDARVDFARVRRWIEGVQRKIEPHDSPQRFRGLGVDVVEGHARLRDEHTVEVDGRLLLARRIVIATGSRPAVPPVAGLDAVPYHTNETIFQLEMLPRRLIVLGGGPIGLELAQAFGRLGSEVTVIEAGATLLPREDVELATILGERLVFEGVRLLLGCTAERAERRADGTIALHVRAGDAALHVVEGDVLLVATGRVSNVTELGLEAVGVTTGRDGVVVDDRLRTTVPGIFACGDVIGGLRFTHVADYEARLVIRNALLPVGADRDYRVVPWVTFTDPELAHVGLTEAEARERHGDRIEAWRQPFTASDRAIAEGRTTGLVKLVSDRRGRILGGHVLGHGAEGMIQEIALAMQHGLPVGQLASVVRAYPTYASAVRGAAEMRIKSRFRGPVKALTRWIVRRGE